jgi:UDP-N-acetylglucosamine 2-epimerase (non-hydrolysing)
MKILTVAGTRPELIRLSRIIPKLDERCDHVLVWTGQNYSDSLSTIFFEDLGIRRPNYWQPKPATLLTEQLSNTFICVGGAAEIEQPDRALVLGDTNSALSAIVLERMGIPVYHMEAGNRCFDLKVPEEKNRRVIDAVSSVNMPYTRMSMQNLLHEGVSRESIFVSGNPIYEVLRHYAEEIGQSKVLEELGLMGEMRPKPYFVATFHRQENVDDMARLEQIIVGLRRLTDIAPVVCSIHPRTKQKMERFQIDGDGLILHEPFGFFDFVMLEKEAMGALTDSGTVQEECCLFGVPTVTMRDSTERPETVECGSNIVSGVHAHRIHTSMREMLAKGLPAWTAPIGYEDPMVSEKVANKLISP